MPSGTVSRAIRNAVLAAGILLASNGAGAADLPSTFSDGEFPATAAVRETAPRSPCLDARLSRRGGRLTRRRRTPKAIRRGEAAGFENHAAERLEAARVSADEESRVRVR
jgi:hypothetical protein